MTPWQKRARLGVAAVAAVVVVLVLVTIRERPSDNGASEITRLDPRAVKESSGGVHLPMKGAESSGPIAYEHLLEYPDGTAKMIGVRARTERNGRPIVITAREARVAADRSTIRLVGDVRVTSGDDLDVRTSEADYDQNRKFVRASKRVSFRKGAMSGTSQGMTYDEGRDVLTLLSRVRVRVAADGERGPGEITAGFAEYIRDDRVLRFEKAVRMVREGQVITAERAVARLTEDEERLEALDLRGGARIEKPDAAPGGLQAMRGERMELTYAPDGETLQRAVLTGKASITEAGRGGGARRISAEIIDLTLTADGGIEQMSARHRVQLTLPASGDAPERVVRSQSMAGTGGPDGGLAAARFEGDVQFSERRKDGGRVGRSRTLEIAMGSSGGIEEARFAGGTRFQDGTLRTASDQARYNVAKGTLQLIKDAGGRNPTVEDGRLTVEAPEIEVGFEGPTLSAAGGVRSVLRPEQRGTNGQRRERAVPGMLEKDEPVYVTGDELEYSGDKGLATYTGNARLWQGETMIRGHQIVIDETSGDLSASIDPTAKTPGLVRSAFVLDDRDEKTGEVTQVPSTAVGRRFEYEEAHRRATYTRDARVTGPQGDVQADRIELYFVEGGGSLDRAEAYDHVQMKDPQRSATGHRLTYFGDEGRYVMTGTPVKIVRECDETFGKSLTFWRSTDRILVDGNEGNRTLTKTGGTCAGQRSK
ncbi:MAG TPA: LPS export ABC transporter periplasmic protein LptC [Vicinamibacterales bacterium]|nr:LPS export ABC transporter periplasmic protein LptC [Vicinamibacterales bacterium]